MKMYPISPPEPIEINQKLMHQAPHHIHFNNHTQTKLTDIIEGITQEQARARNLAG
jgi:hypothetical protein